MTSDNVLHLFTHLFKRVERIELDFLIELTTFKYFLTRKQPNWKVELGPLANILP